MIAMTANCISYSSYSGISISEFNAFSRKIKNWKDYSIAVFSWVFSVTIRISFVCGVRMRVGGDTFFKCSYVVLVQVNVHEGVSNSLFCC